MTMVTQIHTYYTYTAISHYARNIIVLNVWRCCVLREPCIILIHIDIEHILWVCLCVSRLGFILQTHDKWWYWWQLQYKDDDKNSNKTMATTFSQTHYTRICIHYNGTSIKLKARCRIESWRKKRKERRIGEEKKNKRTQIYIRWNKINGYNIT